MRRPFPRSLREDLGAEGQGARIEPVWRKVEVSSHLCAGHGEGIREWIRWFEIRRAPKGEHIHVFGSPLHKAQGLESGTSNHYKLKTNGREPELLLQGMEEPVEICGSKGHATYSSSVQDDHHRDSGV